MPLENLAIPCSLKMKKSRKNFISFSFYPNRNFTSERTLFRHATYILLLLRRQQKGPMHRQHALLWEKFQDRKSARTPASGVQVCACDFQTDAARVRSEPRVLIEIAGPLLPSHVLHHFLESWSNEKWECAGTQSSIELGFFENYKKREKNSDLSMPIPWASDQASSRLCIYLTKPLKQNLKITVCKFVRKLFPL